MIHKAYCKILKKPNPPSVDFYKQTNKYSFILSFKDFQINILGNTDDILKLSVKEEKLTKLEKFG